MRERAKVRLNERNASYERGRNTLLQDIRTWEGAEADLQTSERSAADLRRKLDAAGCELPPRGSLISFLPAPSALGAPLPPTPTTQVLGSVTRVPPKQPQASCDELPGTWTWAWGHGDVNKQEGKKGERATTITKDHKMSQTGNDGTWTCSGNAVTFRWRHSTDILTIVDTQTLQGQSNLGDWVAAKKQQ